MIHEPSLPRHVPLLRIIDLLSECCKVVLRTAPRSSLAEQAACHPYTCEAQGLHVSARQAGCSATPVAGLVAAFLPSCCLPTRADRPRTFVKHGAPMPLAAAVSERMATWVLWAVINIQARMDLGFAEV